jgi:hypothetical protein
VATLPVKVLWAFAQEFYGPVRAWLIRRATGRHVYWAKGRLHERRRHARLKDSGD